MTRADLERAKNVAEVDLSEWIDGEDATGYVCAISAANVIRLDAFGGDDDGDITKERDATYAWVVSCFCDSSGSLILHGDKETLEWLGDRPFKMLQAICEAAATINGASKKGQEETAKN